MPGRRAFVTVGATARFTDLVREVLSPEFISGIQGLGFDTLEIQCGADYDLAKELIPAVDDRGVKIEAFAFAPELTEHFIAARGNANESRPAGVIISHGGAGTVMEVIRLDCALILVPNSTLMNNHQVELVEYLDKKEWAIYGHLGKLTEAVSKARERIFKGRLDELSPYQELPFPVPEEDRLTVFDYVLLTCYPEERLKLAHQAEHAEWEKGLQDRKAAAAVPVDLSGEVESRLHMD